MNIVAFSAKIDNLRFSVQNVKIELWKKYRDSKSVFNKHVVIVLQNKSNGRSNCHNLFTL